MRGDVAFQILAHIAAMVGGGVFGWHFTHSIACAALAPFMIYAVMTR